jgi:hypothetical protein
MSDVIKPSYEPVPMLMPKEAESGPSYDPRVDPRKFVAESHKHSPKASEKLK